MSLPKDVRQPKGGTPMDALLRVSGPAPTFSEWLRRRAIVQGENAEKNGNNEGTK